MIQYLKELIDTWVFYVNINGLGWREKVLIGMLIITGVLFALAYIARQEEKVIHQLFFMLGMFSVMITWIILIAIPFYYQNVKGLDTAKLKVAEGNYILAMEELEKIRGFDSAKELEEEIYPQYMYQLGMEYKASGNYIKAVDCFIESYYYSDSIDQLAYCMEKYLNQIKER